MPAKKNRDPQTFNDYLARVVDSRITKRRRRYDEVAEHAQIPLSNFGRRMRGAVPFTADEIARIGAYLDVDPAEMLHEALEDFGGIGSLLSEVRHSNETPESPQAEGSNDEFGNVTQLSRRESKEVNPQKQAAHRRRKDQNPE